MAASSPASVTCEATMRGTYRQNLGLTNPSFLVLWEWRRGWDSAPITSCTLCNLQTPRCCNGHECHQRRRALPAIAADTRSILAAPPQQHDPHSDHADDDGGTISGMPMPLNIATPVFAACQPTHKPHELRVVGARIIEGNPARDPLARSPHAAMLSGFSWSENRQAGQAAGSR
jgi:hypothetical protein